MSENTDNNTVSVNPDACIGCGMCVAQCNEIFKFQGNPYAEVIKQPETDQELACAKGAALDCPTGAIIVKD